MLEKEFKYYLDKSIEKYELGTFMIMPCSPGDEAYTIHTHKMIFA